MPLQVVKNILARKKKDLNEAETISRQAAEIIKKYIGSEQTIGALQYRPAQQTLYVATKTKAVASELFLQRGGILAELRKQGVEIRKIVIR